MNFEFFPNPYSLGELLVALVIAAPYIAAWILWHKD